MAITQPADAGEAEVDFAEVIAWLSKRQVFLAGLLLVAASVAWKAQFLYRRYFYQDDFVDLDIARRSGFSWHYLGLVSDDHFFPGLRAITWVLARASLYDWGLDSTVLLIFAAAASLAGLRLLRTLFGDRPAILVPLVIYLVLPVTVPDLGWWWTGMESVPFQLAIFMTLNAHVRYLRTGRWRHLGAAVGWLTFGLLFFEKGVVLPLLLFAITSAFCVNARSWLGGMAGTLRQHWRAWLSYAVVLIVYGLVALVAFRGSRSISHPATSMSVVRTFASYFVRNNLLPGLFGGPWHWLAAGPGSRYAIALPSTFMVTVCEIATVVLLAANLWIRPIAWRAWAIFATWVVLADMATVIVGRLGFGLVTFFALETRYLADAAPVLAVCFGLACLPVAGAGERAAKVQRVRGRLRIGIDQRLAATILVAAFLVSAIWSDQRYQNLTNGSPAVAAYMRNTDRALTHATPGTFIIDQAMPTNAILPSFGAQANQSQIIGALATAKQSRRLHWITQAVGTIDNLKMFSGDGHLVHTLISGAYSVKRTGRGLKSCWPYRHRHIVVKFARPTEPFAQTLHIGYVWGGGAPGFLVVQYGDSAQRLYLTPGVHSAYLSVSGSVTEFAIDGARGRYLCVGMVASGQLVPF